MVRFTRSSLIMGDGPTEGREGRALARPPALRPARRAQPARRAEERLARTREQKQAGWQGPHKTIK